MIYLTDVRQFNIKTINFMLISYLLNLTRLFLYGTHFIACGYKNIRQFEKKNEKHYLYTIAEIFKYLEKKVELVEMLFFFFILKYG